MYDYVQVNENHDIALKGFENMKSFDIAVFKPFSS